jgi:oxygen-independent coproporphyrinogen-3 oxidase
MHEYFAAELEQMKPLADAGLVTVDDHAIQVPADGWYLGRAVAMVFDRHLQANRTRDRFSRIV